ncbi:hypothetical protein CFI10_11525 [Marinobacterium iners]|uniref:hypothetical protein n=1 Tax=Marinobacterium iners TaxID=48076 RepID=UPI001A8D141D|nr:hypothetical protein [Marinobacterium iners]QSR35619.1 hypothetical protein CFI10_11525 [Marinobacterium iners]
MKYEIKKLKMREVLESHESFSEDTKRRLDRLKGIYEKKLELIEILMEEGDVFDEMLKEFASIGGKVSGIIREHKSDIAMIYLFALKEANEEVFSDFSVNHYRVLAKEMFDFAPTTNSLLILLNQEQHWTDRKITVNRRDYKEAVVELVEGAGLNCKSEFNSIYSDFRSKVQILSEESSDKFKELKRLVKS